MTLLLFFDKHTKMTL